MKLSNFLLLFVFFTAGTALGAVVLSEKDGGWQLSLNINQHHLSQTTVEGAAYTTVVMEDALFEREADLPKLPYEEKQIRLPRVPAGRKYEASIVESVARTTVVDADPIPVSRPVRRGEPEMVPVRGDFYSSQAVYPAESFTFSLAFHEDAYTSVYRILFFPVRYDAAEKAILFTDRLVVDVRVVDDSSFTRSRNSALPADLTTLLSAERMLLGEVLYIGPETYLSEMGYYLDWKRARGLNVSLARYPEDTGEGSGALREWLRSRYLASPFEYLVIVGNGNDVPPATEVDIFAPVSDVYYAQIVGARWISDILHSRISVYSHEHLHYQLNRFMAYETRPLEILPVESTVTGVFCFFEDESGARFYRKALCTAQPFLGLYRKNLGHHVKFLAEGMIKNAIIPSALIRPLNTGCNFFMYDGHGVTYALQYMHARDLVYTSTPGMPFVFLGACLTGRFFDESGAASFSEDWMMLPAADGKNNPIGIMSAIDIVGESEVEFLEEVLISIKADTFDKGLVLGEIAARMQARSSGLGGIGVTRRWQLFGDATSVYYQRPPERLYATFPHVVPQNSGWSLTVTNSNGQGVSSAAVCVSADDGWRFAALTDEDGQVELPAYAGNQHMVRVVVFKPNAAPVDRWVLTGAAQSVTVITGEVGGPITETLAIGEGQVLAGRGALPAGMVMNDGQLSGVPTEKGNYGFEVKQGENTYLYRVEIAKTDGLVIGNALDRQITDGHAFAHNFMPTGGSGYFSVVTAPGSIMPEGSFVENGYFIWPIPQVGSYSFELDFYESEEGVNLGRTSCTLTVTHAMVVIEPAQYSAVEGSSLPVKVTLHEQPDANVYVYITTGKITCALINRTPICFTPENWETPQDILITFPHNESYWGDMDIVFEPSVSSSSDPRFDSVSFSPFTIEYIEIDPVPHVSVTAVGGEFAYYEDDAVPPLQLEFTLSVKPHRFPTTLNVATTDLYALIGVEEGVLTPLSSVPHRASVVITEANWAGVHRVWIKPVQDDFCFPRQTHSLTITVDTDSYREYGFQKIISLERVDDDLPAVNVEVISGGSLTEDGGSVVLRFTVAKFTLGTSPLVSVRIRDQDLGYFSSENNPFHTQFYLTPYCELHEKFVTVRGYSHEWAAENLFCNLDITIVQSPKVNGIETVVQTYAIPCTGYENPVEFAFLSGGLVFDGSKESRVVSLRMTAPPQSNVDVVIDVVPPINDIRIYPRSFSFTPENWRKERLLIVDRRGAYKTNVEEIVNVEIVAQVLTNDPVYQDSHPVLPVMILPQPAVEGNDLIDFFMYNTTYERSVHADVRLRTKPTADVIIPVYVTTPGVVAGFFPGIEATEHSMAKVRELVITPENWESPGNNFINFPIRRYGDVQSIQVQVGPMTSVDVVFDGQMGGVFSVQTMNNLPFWPNAGTTLLRSLDRANDRMTLGYKYLNQVKSSFSVVAERRISSGATQTAHLSYDSQNPNAFFPAWDDRFDRPGYNREGPRYWETRIVEVSGFEPLADWSSPWMITSYERDWDTYLWSNFWRNGKPVLCLVGQPVQARVSDYIYHDMAAVRWLALDVTEDRLLRPLTGGTVVCESQASEDVMLPFEVALGGETYTGMTIHRNGFLFLTNSRTVVPEVAGFPQHVLLDEWAILAPLWGNYAADSIVTVEVFEDAGGSEVTAVWTVLTQHGGEWTLVEFGASIDAHGKIRYRYGDVEDGTVNAMIGIGLNGVSHVLHRGFLGHTARSRMNLLCGYDFSLSERLPDWAVVQERELVGVPTQAGVLQLDLRSRENFAEPHFRCFRSKFVVNDIAATLSLTGGQWNLVSIPMFLENGADVIAYNIRNRAEGDIWTWEESQYVRADTFFPGVAYWVYVTENKSFQLRGISARRDRATLTPGRLWPRNSWGMVGVEKVQNPPGNGFMFGWQNEFYTVPVELVPTAGYWLWFK